MSTPTVSATRTARLVGALRARPARLPRAGRRPAPRRRRRPHRRGHPAAQRARPDRRPRRQPHHRHPRVCRAPRERLPHLPPRVGLGRDPADRAPPAAARARSSRQTSSEGVIDLTCAATPRAGRGSSRPTSGRCGQLPRYLTGAGYLTLGVPELREVIADALHRARAADQRRRGARDVGRGRRHRRRAARPARPRRPGRRREPHATPTPSTPCAAGWRPARAARPWTPTAGTSPRPSRTVRSAGRRRRPAHPRLPQPDRRAHGRRRPGGAGPGPEARPAPCRSSTRRSPRSSSTHGPMPLPFAAHDPRAVSVGSSSKSHWGGLRTGWIRAPRTVAAPRWSRPRVTTDLGAPVLEQLVLLELMRVAPGLTPERRDDLRGLARRPGRRPGRTPARAAASRCRAAGSSCGASCPRASTRRGVALAAEDEGLLVAAGPRFSVAGGFERWLRLPYVLAAGGDDGCRHPPGARRRDGAGGRRRTRRRRSAAGRAAAGRTHRPRPLVA